MSTAPTALSARLDQMRHNEPGELHIIDRIQVGDRVTAEEQVVDMTTPNGDGYPFSPIEKLDRVTGPSPWYRSNDNPWGRPIVPFEMYTVLSDKSRAVRGVRRPSNRLFIDLEGRAVDGPLFGGEPYIVAPTDCPPAGWRASPAR